MYTVMTVCHGNICRSPMAQMVLIDRFAAAGLDVMVDSTGVSAEEEGNPIDRRAAHVLAAHGYPIVPHRARQVALPELLECDLILAATGTHAARLQRLAGRHMVADRIRLIRSFDPQLAGQRNLDMADPWYGGPADFEATLAEIEAAAPGIVDFVGRELRQ